MAINVPITNYSSEKISRHELLNWVNDTLCAKHNKIEELCSGVSYCQLMNKLFPGSIIMKRLKSNAKMDHEYIWNLKLFQQAFTKVNCDKTVPIEQLMKGKFQDNFEFLLWFKKFYEVNSGTNNSGGNITTANLNNKIQETNNNIIKSTVKKSSNTITTTAVKTSQSSSSKSSTKGSTPPRAQTPKKDGAESPSSLQTLTLQRDILKEHVETLEKEKIFYFERLRKVETLCDDNEDNAEFIEVIKKVRNLLYDTNVEEIAANELETIELKAMTFDDALEVIVQENLNTIDKLEENINSIEGKSDKILDIIKKSNENLTTLENLDENLDAIEKPNDTSTEF